MKRCFVLLSFGWLAMVCGPLHAQTKLTSMVSLVEVCNGQILDWDHERALINFNPTTQVLELSTDIYEAIDNVPAGEDDTQELYNGEQLRLEAQLRIPDLAHRTASDNGTSQEYECKVFCHGEQYLTRVKFTFFHAPVAAQPSGGELSPFRLDFTVVIDAKALKLQMAEGCTEVVLKVTDAWLNVVH